MAPLWDFSKGQFVGVLSALDFILILREVCIFFLFFNANIAIVTLTVVIYYGKKNI